MEAPYRRKGWGVGDHNVCNCHVGVEIALPGVEEAEFGIGRW